MDLLHILIRMFVSRPVVGRTYLALAYLLGFVLTLGLASQIRGRISGAHLDTREAFPYVLTASAGPVAIAVAVSLFKPLIVDRYFVIVTPAACVLLALGVAQLSQRYAMAPLVLVLAVGLLTSAWGVATTRWKEDWRGVTAYVTASSEPRDAILLPSGQGTPFNHYYTGTLTQASIPQGPAGQDVIEQVLTHIGPFARVWVVSTDRSQASDAVIDYIITARGCHLESCREFGGFFGVEVCLYTTDAA
jgi:hypothetical protein